MTYRVADALRDIFHIADPDEGEGLRLFCAVMSLHFLPLTHARLLPSTPLSPPLPYPLPILSNSHFLPLGRDGIPLARHGPQRLQAGHGSHCALVGQVVTTRGRGGKGKVKEEGVFLSE